MNTNTATAQKPNTTTQQSPFDGQAVSEKQKQIPITTLPKTTLIRDAKSERRLLKSPNLGRDLEKLTCRLEAWLNVLQSGENLKQMQASAMQNAEAADQCLNKNLASAAVETRELETAWRSLSAWFENAGNQVEKNILTLFNASAEDIGDSKDLRLQLAAELKEEFDQISLKRAYSILAIPGWMGDKTSVESLAKECEKNMVLLVTDFEDAERPEDIVNLQESHGLRGEASHWANVVMPVNYLVSRGRDSKLSEQEDLVIPPSAAFAGGLLSVAVSDTYAGYHCPVGEVKGVRMKALKSETDAIYNMRLTPSVMADNKVMFWSDATLYDGEFVPELSSYPVWRTHRAIGKDLIYFLNKNTWVKFTYDQQEKLRRIVKTYLNMRCRMGDIKSFKIEKFGQDPNDPRIVHLDITINPEFPTAKFPLRLKTAKDNQGQTGDWEK